MSRSFVCLCFCLLFGLVYHETQTDKDALPDRPAAEAFRPEWLAPLACAPEVCFPASVPWVALLHLQGGTAAVSDPLPYGDPEVFLEKCLDRYNQTVKTGYTLTMYKHERVDNDPLYPPEMVDVWMREQPHGVLMKWRTGARQAKAALWVEGENNNNIAVKPAAFDWLPIMNRPLTAADVKKSGRFGIDEFGLKMATERVLANMKKARARNALKVEYLGVYRLAEAGDRLCYKLHRRCIDRPDNDGVNDVVVYYDTETWLQVGSVLHDAEDRLLGEYYFRDIRLNPDFPPGQFSRDVLKK